MKNIYWPRVAFVALLWTLAQSIAFARSSPFTPTEIEWMKDHPVINFVAESNVSPIEFVEQGVYKGLAAEYLNAIAQATGLEFRLVPVKDWDEAQRAFMDGRADLFPNISPHRVRKEVAEKLTLTDPYFVAPSIIVTRADEPVILNLKGLYGQTLVLRRGGFYADAVSHKHPDAKILFVDKPGELLEAVATGAAYATIGPDSVLIPAIRRSYPGRLGVSGAYPELAFACQMGVRSDMTILNSIIGKALGSLSASYTDRLDERWLQQADFGKPSLGSIVQYRLPALLAVVAIIVLLIWIAKQARTAKRLAQANDRAKSSFLATMSHEIRTPLNAIMGNLELLSYSKLDQLQHERLKTIMTSSTGLLGIISDILDFSKIEAEQMSIEKIDCDVFEVVERSLVIFAPVAQSKGLELLANYEGDDHLFARTAPDRLGQIINNLLSNAIKFTSEGKVIVHVKSTATYGDGSARKFVVEVEDTGIGMSPEAQANVFDAFTQADGSISRKYGGTGLGLALSQSLAVLLGGRLEVRSTRGVGSVFTLSLPLLNSTTTTERRHLSSPQLVVLLSASIDWPTFLSRHLIAWGAVLEVFVHPKEIPEPILRQCKVLLICGDRDDWHPYDETRLSAAASMIVDCTSDGPPRPSQEGRRLTVSCYSLEGIWKALQQALSGEAVSPSERHAPETDGSLILSRPMRVLLVEDNHVNQELMAAQLSLLGCKACVVDRAAKAIEALETQDWDLLLTDLSMPEMDGFQLAVLVRRRWPSLPIIAVTANASVDEVERCKRSGMEMVLTKPLSLSQLFRALSKWDLAASSPERGSGSAAEVASEATALLGGRELPAHLRQVFLRSCQRSIDVLASSRQDGDAASVRAELHSLCGALNVFGYRAVASECMDLGQLIKTQGLDVASERLLALEADLQTLLEGREINRRASEESAPK